METAKSANAAAVVAQRAPDSYPDVVAGLFADQPEEGTTGLTDEQIAAIAVDAGVPESVTEAKLNPPAETSNPADTWARNWNGRY